MAVQRFVNRGLKAIVAAGSILVATVVPAASASASVWQSSAAFGTARIQGYTFYNNEWNRDHGPQTIWVNGRRNWGVRSDQPGGTGVKTYPEEQKILSLPWNRYSAVWSHFRESGPGVGDWEAAYDLWVGSAPRIPANTEVMIWVYNHGQRPAGRVIGHATIGHQRWQVFYSPSTAGHHVYSFVLHGLARAHETSGVVHILNTLRWLHRHGHLAASAPLRQVDWGWEICSTGGASRRFTTRQFAVHMIKRS